MHICFLTHEYPKEGCSHGGIGTFVRVVGEGLAKRGHRVSVVGINADATEEIERDGLLEVHRLPRSMRRGLTWADQSLAINERLRKIHLGSPIDVVEGAEMSFGFVSKIPNIKYVIRLHGGHYFFSADLKQRRSKWKAWQERRSFRKADGVIAVSDHVWSVTSRCHGLDRFPKRVINYPVPPLEHLSKHHPVSDEAIVFVGTICRKKGVDELVRGFQEVAAVRPLTTLHMIGRDSEHPKGGSYIDHLMAALPDEVRCRIVINGHLSREEALTRMSSAAVCVFPSHSESLGLVAPEAMSCGTTVVFTKTGPGPEVIEDGKDGWLCDPHDPSDIAAKIKKALAMTSEERSAMGESAKNKVADKFGVDKIISQNIEFYAQLKQ